MQVRAGDCVVKGERVGRQLDLAACELEDFFQLAELDAGPAEEGQQERVVLDVLFEDLLVQLVPLALQQVLVQRREQEVVPVLLGVAQVAQHEAELVAELHRHLEDQVEVCSRFELVGVADRHA